MSMMWFLTLAVTLIIPLTMMGFGRAYGKKAPKDRNDPFAYRSGMSKKNQDTWEFAHSVFGGIWFRAGRVMLILSAAVMLLVLGKTEEMVLGAGAAVCCIQVVPLLVLQADWQEVWHSPQPPFFALSHRLRVSMVLMCSMIATSTEIFV